MPRAKNPCANNCQLIIGRASPIHSSARSFCLGAWISGIRRPLGKYHQDTFQIQKYLRGELKAYRITRLGGKLRIPGIYAAILQRLENCTFSMNHNCGGIPSRCISCVSASSVSSRSLLWRVLPFSAPTLAFWNTAMQGLVVASACGNSHLSLSPTGYRFRGNYFVFALTKLAARDYKHFSEMI